MKLFSTGCTITLSSILGGNRQLKLCWAPRIEKNVILYIQDRFQYMWSELERGTLMLVDRPQRKLIVFRKGVKGIKVIPRFPALCGCSRLVLFVDKWAGSCVGIPVRMAYTNYFLYSEGMRKRQLDCKELGRKGERERGTTARKSGSSC